MDHSSSPQSALMGSADFDLAICGAGPPVWALALLLAKYRPNPVRIALIGRRPTGDQPASAPRAIALDHGSRQLLKSIQGWRGRSAAIQPVHVSQRGYLARTLIEADDMGVPS